MTESSTEGIKTVLHPVSDLEAAKKVYTALLGIEPQTDSSYYVGYDVAGQHIGLVPNGGPQGMTSPVAYWHVPDIEAKLAEVTAAGADREGGRARRRRRPPGGRHHRPRRQRPRAAARPMTADPRAGAQRRQDTEHRLTHDIDVWVASASPDGAPYLTPLSFDWDGEALLLATPTKSPTGRNLAATGTVRLALGQTRDVCDDRGHGRGPRDRRAADGSGGPVRRAQRLRPAYADHPIPLVPHLPPPHPGVARGGRVGRPRADARRPLVGLMSGPDGRV